MNHLKINKDLINIVRSYLYIFQPRVKQLVLYALKYTFNIMYNFNVKLSKLHNIYFGHCLICDEPTEICKEYHYYPSFFIMKYYMPCRTCYRNFVYKERYRQKIRSLN